MRPMFDETRKASPDQSSQARVTMRFVGQLYGIERVMNNSKNQVEPEALRPPQRCRQRSWSKREVSIGWASALRAKLPPLRSWPFPFSVTTVVESAPHDLLCKRHAIVVVPCLARTPRDLAHLNDSKSERIPTHGDSSRRLSSIGTETASALAGRVLASAWTGRWKACGVVRRVRHGALTSVGGLVPPVYVGALEIGLGVRVRRPALRSTRSHRPWWAGRSHPAGTCCSRNRPRPIPAGCA